MIKFIGEKFALDEPFGQQEHAIIGSITKQIEKKWPEHKNLLINLTWFGPQFNNLAWTKMQRCIAQGEKFDQIFWLCAVDPVCILPDQFVDIEKSFGSQQNYYVGVGFDGTHSFNTHAVVVLEEFPTYSIDDLLLKDTVYPFINYNRKPKPHRISLAERLQGMGGIVTLGKNDAGYDVSEGIKTNLYLAIDDPVETYTHNGKFRLQNNFGGIPYDLCSLGRVDLWQQHFLNIVSETVLFPWDTTFVTEKTWKPIVGLRPFIINGQTKIYQWLRDRGFRTFNHHWPHVPIESATEINLHAMIVDVAQFIANKCPQQLTVMYNEMLPDLLHNRQRFFEFAREQKHKIENLFQ